MGETGVLLTSMHYSADDQIPKLDPKRHDYIQNTSNTVPENVYWCQYTNLTLVRSKELPNLNLSKNNPTLEMTNSQSQQKHNSTQKDQPLNLDYF